MKVKNMFSLKKLQLKINEGVKNFLKQYF